MRRSSWQRGAYFVIFSAIFTPFLASIICNSHSDPIPQTSNGIAQYSIPQAKQWLCTAPWYPKLAIWHSAQYNEYPQAVLTEYCDNVSCSAVAPSAGDLSCSIELLWLEQINYCLWLPEVASGITFRFLATISMSLVIKKLESTCHVLLFSLRNSTLASQIWKKERIISHTTGTRTRDPVSERKEHYVACGLKFPNTLKNLREVEIWNYYYYFIIAIKRTNSAVIATLQQSHEGLPKSIFLSQSSVESRDWRITMPNQ